MQKRIYIIISILFIIFLSAIIITDKQVHLQTNNTGQIQIVAAENFYGDIAQQIGGDKVHVLSLLTDPNADPHEYESNVQDAIAVNNANLVIENGDGYDTWMDKLISSSTNKNRIILTAANIAPDKLPDNPHVWYGIDNIKAIASRIAKTLGKQDPSNVNIFAANLKTFDNSLQSLLNKIAEIKKQYNNTPVGLTETIYLYQTQPEGLDVLTPIAFERAIAEGNDPSAQDVATVNDQIDKKQIKILIYNEQTITPITTNMQMKAQNANIPIVPVTETMPKGKHYQSWMMDQLTNLQNALERSK